MAGVEALEALVDELAAKHRRLHRLGKSMQSAHQRAGAIAVFVSAARAFHELRVALAALEEARK